MENNDASKVTSMGKVKVGKPSSMPLSIGSIQLCGHQKNVQIFSWQS